MYACMLVVVLLSGLARAQDPEPEPPPEPEAPENRLPTLEALTIAPDAPRTTDDLTCTPGPTQDPDGDEVTVDLAWEVDGEVVQTTGTTLPADATRNGMVVRCVGTPRDGTGAGESVQSARVTIADTPPVLSSVAVTPADPRHGTEVRCVPGAAEDADGETVTYAFAWTVDGEPAGEGETLAGDRLRKGQTLTCTATPRAGATSGEAVTSAPVEVLDSPPIVGSVRVEPSDPVVASEPACVVEGAVDPDGDEVEVGVLWTVDGAPVEGEALAPGTFTKGQALACTATPSDGTTNGEPVTSEPVVVRNTPPVVDSVAIEPDDPDTDAIVLANAQTSDADGDEVTVAWAWEVAGAPIDSGADGLDGRTAFSHGDTLRVAATPSDGEDAGEPRWSALVTVRNTPPSQPLVAIEDPATRSGALVCQVVEPAIDLDGDPVTYRFAWSLDGEAFTRGPATTTNEGDTIPRSATRLGQEWTCTATPSDGRDDGPASEPDRLVIIEPTAGMGSSHACALQADGRATCWGNRDYGMSDPPPDRLRELSVGGWHNCAIRQRDRGLVCWGHDVYGQSRPPEGEWRAVAAGGWHACALDLDGRISCWGQSAGGRLDAPGGRYASLSAGWKHTCALDEAGAVTCWGEDESGQCDAPSGTWRQVSAGDAHTCGVTTAGEVRCWGEDRAGESSPPPGQFVQVVAGSRFSCGLRSDGKAVCWGFSAYGQLDVPDVRFSRLGRGVDGVCGITVEGGVRCWGRDQHGQTEPPPELR